ncbi:Gfo/Idh/MocA family oxidoreductase [Geomonas paludis]|uniref:Oxidoreductase n=1 Tax=Geomonas paludis TaxID=2740185 RepID=A0A6V8MY54_9BACT|nr:Gfo/Idh/MocA family oxidoreductase [Geomonas paludis]UPU34475.1 Gfo/Idh/MocA family oxidoreductase [Geomonas paludis]GFO64463.1 oxidoreductase [Geomonas paludis]
MINVGIVGYGYWGPNVARNFHQTPGAKVTAICDTDQKSLCRAQADFPDAELVHSYQELVLRTDIDIVAIVTPVSLHFEIARLALENGKHVFVEKPFTASGAQAEQLIELADRKHLKIMVDHTFLFTGAVNKIKELLDNKILGDLYYFDSVRVNLGLFQKDVNVLWDLAPHDISIMDYLIGLPPTTVTATGVSHFNSNEDVAYVTLYFPDNVIAHLHVNWLSPVKVRTTLIGGQNKMLVWNDLENDEKIKVYDKGAYHDGMMMAYRSGDMWAPKVPEGEALKKEVQYFLSCISNDITPINDGRAGLRVVRVLEAIKESLKWRGAPVRL